MGRLGSTRRWMMWWSLLLAAGCGGSPPPLGPVVEGKLTMNGKPLEIAPMVGYIEMFLIPEANPTADPQSASVAPDGTYRVRGTQERGVVPGKFKVVVRQFGTVAEKDMLGGKFDRDKTPVILEIKAGEPIQKLDIDLAKFGK